jgi:hypothetical protein
MPADLPIGTRGTFHRPLSRYVRTNADDAKADDINKYIGLECEIVGHDLVWDYEILFADGKRMTALRTNFVPLAVQPVK